MEGSNGSPATSIFMQQVYRGPPIGGKDRSPAGFRNAVICRKRVGNFVRHWRQECRVDFRVSTALVTRVAIGQRVTTCIRSDWMVWKNRLMPKRSNRTEIQDETENEGPQANS